MTNAFHIQREFASSTKLSTQQKSVLYGAPLLYAFKGSSHQQVTFSYEKSDIRSSVLDFRRSLWSNGDLLRDVKAFAYAKATDQAIPNHRWKISQSDRAAVKHALTWAPLNKHLNLLSKKGYVAYTPDRISSLAGRALHNKDVSTYIDKFVYKKHSFLKSYGKDAEDIKVDLVGWGFYALLKAYPQWNDAGHMLAIAKTAIHNRGINIISESVSEARQSLIKRPDGTYESLIVSLDSLPTVSPRQEKVDTSEAYVSTSYLYVGLDGKQTDDYFDKLSLRQLTENPKLKPKQRLFLQLLLGQPNEDFSAFLGLNNSQAAFDWSFDRYFKKVVEFLRVSEDAARKFLMSLRKCLGD